jgi:hypothetical protein
MILLRKTEAQRRTKLTLTDKGDFYVRKTRQRHYSNLQRS